MKYVVITRLAPGTENSRKALEVFTKAGVPQGTQALYAGVDGKTFINVIDSETPDLVGSSTYAPFFEKSKVIPVVDADAAWLESVQAAQGNWG